MELFKRLSLLGMIAILLTSCGLNNSKDINANNNVNDVKDSSLLSKLHCNVERVVISDDEGKFDINIDSNILTYTNRKLSVFIECDYKLESLNLSEDVLESEMPHFKGEVKKIQFYREQEIFIPAYLNYSTKAIIDVVGISNSLIIEKENIDQISALYIPSEIKDFPSLCLDGLYDNTKIYFEGSEHHDDVVSKAKVGLLTYGCVYSERKMTSIFGGAFHVDSDHVYTLGVNNQVSQLMYKYLDDDNYHYFDLTDCKDFNGEIIKIGERRKYLNLYNIVIKNMKHNLDLDHVYINNILLDESLTPMKVKVMIEDNDFLSYHKNDIKTVEEFDALKDGEIVFIGYPIISNETLLNADTGFVSKKVLMAKSKIMFQKNNLIKAIKQNGRTRFLKAFDYFDKPSKLNVHELGLDEILVGPMEENAYKCSNLTYVGERPSIQYAINDLTEVNYPIWKLSDGNEVILHYYDSYAGHNEYLKPENAKQKIDIYGAGYMYPYSLRLYQLIVFEYEFK